MIVVLVMYPLKPESRFDAEYYLKKHMPMVRARWTPFGLQEAIVLKGAPGADGKPPLYPYIAELRFGSQRQLQDALAQHGKEVMGDVPNYTDVSPVLQVNEVIG